MFKSLWCRFLNQRRSSLRRSAPSRQRVQLRLECLEDRLVPTNVSATISGTTLTIAKTSGDDTLTINSVGASFAEVTVSTTAGNTINNGVSGGSFTTPSKITAITVNLGSGNDSLTFEDVNLTGNLKINGTGGNKTIVATDVNLWNAANLSMNLAGAGTENTTLTDMNVGGSATIMHMGSGGTNLSIGTDTSTLVNYWGSLAVTNGQGADQDLISDTNFTGSVNINNGQGDGNSQDSNAIEFSASNSSDRLGIGGNVTLSTTSGPSVTDLFDYNVGGNVSMTTGSGTSGQQTANAVAIGTDPGFTQARFGGNVTINGTPDATQGLRVGVGGSDGVIIHGNLGITTTGPGQVTTTAQNSTVVSNASISMQGSGTALTTFTDCDVLGAATINHMSSGNPTLAITASGSPNVLNKWGSLSVTNGSSGSSTTIQDTDFAGNVSINGGNAPNGSTNMMQISAVHNTGLLTIGGNLSLIGFRGATAEGVSDYNVDGNVTLQAGLAATGQTTANFIDLEDNRTSSTSGTPVIKGNVSITAHTVTGVTPYGLYIYLGTGLFGGNYPLVIDGSLSISAGGSNGGFGAVAVALNALTVPDAATSVNLSNTTSNDLVEVQNDSSSLQPSLFQAFTINSSAAGSNTFSIQDSAGAIDFGGPVNVLLSPSNNTVNLGADVNNQTGVNSAFVFFYGTTTFRAGKGTNTFYGAQLNPLTFNNNIFFIVQPTVTGF